MPTCVVKHCKNNTQIRKKADGVTFHLFPTKSETKNKWVAAVTKSRNEPQWQPSKRSVICSDHFYDYDFYVTNRGLCRVIRNRCPTKNLVKSPDVIPDNDNMPSPLPSTSFAAYLTDQPQTIPLPNPSPGDKCEVDDDDSIYERDVSPVRTEDEGEATVPEGSSRRHEGCRCDVCRGQIFGFRYACVECANFDLCSACEARALHAHHYVLRVPASKLHSDVRAVIQQIREQLLKDVNIKEDKDDTIEENSIKVEIKEEYLEQEDPLEQTAGPLQGAGGQSIKYEESEDSKAVNFLGLSERGELPVFEVPLSHQLAVPRDLFHAPKIMTHQPQILSHHPQVLSHQPAMPQVLSHGPKVLSQQFQILSHQSAVPQVLSHQPVMISHQPKVLTHQPSVISHQPNVLAHQPAVLSHQPKDQSKVQSKRKVLSHQPAILQVISHQPAVPQVISHQPAVPQVISHQPAVPQVISHQPAVPQMISNEPPVPQVLPHESQIPHASSHEKTPMMLDEPTSGGDESKPRKKRKK